MSTSKRSFGKRLSQLISKVLWHLNQHPAPIYSYIDSNCFGSSSKRSRRKHGSQSSYYKKSLLERSYIRSQYPARYRTCLICQRTPTLSSIPEE